MIIIRHRRATRLSKYDYLQPGAYFVTICVQDMECFLGEIIDAKMILNDTGKIVNNSWKWLGEQYNYIELDQFIVMPNHVHGIIIINGDRRGGSRAAPTEDQSTAIINRKSLGGIIGAFKTVSTKQINILDNTIGNKFWQRNYYENVVRNEQDLARVREYIVNNPVKWQMDEYYVK